MDFTVELDESGRFVIPPDAIRLEECRNGVFQRGPLLFVTMARGHITVVEDTLLVRILLISHTFCASAQGYVVTRTGGKNVKLHRMIMRNPVKLVGAAIYEVDHINGNKLDNRLVNLRNVPKRVNCANRRNLMRNNTSGHVGITDRGHAFTAMYRKSGASVHKMFGISAYGSRDTALQAAIEWRSARQFEQPEYKEALFS